MRRAWRTAAATSASPNEFRDTTELVENSYPLYCRRNNARMLQRCTLVHDNWDVVPYNPRLLLMYRCHVNVEVTFGIRFI